MSIILDGVQALSQVVKRNLLGVMEAGPIWEREEQMKNGEQPRGRLSRVWGGGSNRVGL